MEIVPTISGRPFPLPQPNPLMTTDLLILQELATSIFSPSWTVYTAPVSRLLDLLRRASLHDEVNGRLNLQLDHFRGRKLSELPEAVSREIRASIFTAATGQMLDEGTPFEAEPTVKLLISATNCRVAPEGREDTRDLSVKYCEGIERRALILTAHLRKYADTITRTTAVQVADELEVHLRALLEEVRHHASNFQCYGR